MPVQITNEDSSNASFWISVVNIIPSPSTAADVVRDIVGLKLSEMVAEKSAKAASDGFVKYTLDVYTRDKNSKENKPQEIYKAKEMRAINVSEQVEKIDKRK